MSETRVKGLMRYSTKGNKIVRPSRKPKKKRRPQGLANYWKTKCSRAESTEDSQRDNSSQNTSRNQEEPHFLSMGVHGGAQERELKVPNITEPQNENLRFDLSMYTKSPDTLITTNSKLTPISTYSLQGRRIINLKYFVEQIISMDDHLPFHCSFKDMDPKREIRRGLNSGFMFKCRLCGLESMLWTDIPDNSVETLFMDVNSAAVSGTMSTGEGHAQLDEMMSTMNIPCMSSNTFKKYHDRLGDEWEKAAQCEMEDAVKLEIEEAKKRGHIAADGTPLLTMAAGESDLTETTTVRCRVWDLSQTAITYLPTGGLEDLDTLRIKDTDSLKVIPSVYSFKHLKEAWLTYSFHCCAFKFPARHNPSRHALHQAYLAKIEEYCNGQEYDDTGQRHSQGQQRVNRHRRGGKQRQQVSEGITALYTPFLTPTSDQWDPFLKEESQSFGPLSGQEWDKAKEENWLEVAGSDESRERNPEDGGVFHQTTATLTATKLHALCGNLSVSSTSVHCRPEPNPFNPCEDIMGYTWLRVSVWFVVVTACFGNLAVLLVLLSRMMDVSVPKFLMCHLAFADLCMGVYLLILASMDLHSSTVYFNYAYDWQIGTGCQVAGFITVFASQLSIFTLTILTLERWFAITYAIYLNKRLKLCTAAQIMAGGWTYSLVMAALPLFGISSYSTTSICLPLEVRDVTDISYLVCLLLINSLAFLVIAVCYIQIYHSLGQETRRPSHSTKGEMTVAKKMALLVLTDFACWAPIAFFSGTALAGYPLIDVTRSKILLVFFYPLNSCANPYLYAILTAQYRRDLFILLARYGVCTKVAQQYRITYSLPTTNNSNPIPLITRGVDITTTTTNLIEETRLNETRLVPSVANDMGATNHLVNEITTTTNEEVFV